MPTELRRHRPAARRRQLRRKAGGGARRWARSAIRARVDDPQRAPRTASSTPRPTTTRSSSPSRPATISTSSTRSTGSKLGTVVVRQDRSRCSSTTACAARSTRPWRGLDLFSAAPRGSPRGRRRRDAASGRRSACPPLEKALAGGEGRGGAHGARPGAGRRAARQRRQDAAARGDRRPRRCGRSRHLQPAQRGAQRRPISIPRCAKALDTALNAIARRIQLFRLAATIVRGLEPRQHPAARRDRARHHVRRHGRHQHGAWRDDHAWRLCDLRGAAALPDAAAARLDRRLSRRRRPGRIPGRGRRRRAARAQRHPLPLRPAARNPARDLGRQPHPAAGGAHRSSARPTRRWPTRTG